MKKTLVIIIALAVSAGLYAQSDSTFHRFALRAEWSFLPTACTSLSGMKHNPGTSLQLSAGYRLGKYWELMGYAGFRRCEISSYSTYWQDDNVQRLDVNFQQGTFLVWGAHAIFHVLSKDAADDFDGIDPYLFLKYGWMSTSPDWGAGFGFNVYPWKHWGMHFEVELGRYAEQANTRQLYDGSSLMPLRMQAGINYGF